MGPQTALGHFSSHDASRLPRVHEGGCDAAKSATPAAGRFEDDPPNLSLLAVMALALVSLVGCGGQADEGSVHVHGSHAALIADATVVEALTRMAPVLDAKFVIVAANYFAP